MMVFSSTILFIFLTALQSGFVASLPEPLLFTPLFFSISIYIIQHWSLRIGALWLLGYGVLIDIFSLNNIHLETLSYSAAAVVALFLSKHVFSNRSIYGILGCASICFLTLRLTQSIIQGIVWINKSEIFDWKLYLHESLWSFILLIVSALILFSFAGQIKKFLLQTFILQKSDDTL